MVCYGQQEADQIQKKADTKSHRPSSMSSVKKSSSHSDSSISHRPAIHDKRWTDGSVAWSTLPQNLVSLGKVQYLADVLVMS